MHKIIRVAFKSALVILAIYLGVSVAAGIILAEAALHPLRRPLDNRAEYAVDAMQQAHAILQDVSVTASDGSVLKAWYAQPSAYSGSSVILLHGVADNREGVSGYAWMFLRHGYAVLMPDSRAHGQSGGVFATYGVLERDDIGDWAHWLRPKTPSCEYLFGESMGAAIAIESTARVPGLCAIAAEDPFETFREIAYDRIAQQTGTPEPWARILGRPAIEAGLFYTYIRYHVRLAGANPLQAEIHSHVPSLLITGTADANIPMRHATALHNAAPNHTSLWIVDGAEHTGAMQVDPAKFQQMVIQWFSGHQLPIAN